MLPPPLQQITPYLVPSGSVTWVDEAGFHMKSVSPFPGSQALAQGGIAASLVGQNALLASILLPSLNRARETANRVKCASNMRQIGQAMLLYSNENKGKYPQDLGTLIKTQDITADVFVCPSGDTTIPPEIRGAGLEKAAEWVNANSDYVYLGKGFGNTAPADQVMLYEKPDAHDRDGMNMLFGDGHVEWQTMPGAQRLLEQQKVKIGPKEGEL
jgi:prepilin-type processing-associated H-X9-DG protein